MSYQPGTFGQPPNYYGSGRLEEEFSGQCRILNNIGIIRITKQFSCMYLEQKNFVIC